MNDLTNRADIEHLIETFYDRVFTDELIGYVFTSVAHVTPETHFPLLADFWETVLFGKNRYHGNVIQKHMELHLKHALTPHQFDRWVALFCQTMDSHYSGPVAETAKTRVRAMSMVLQAKINTLTANRPA